MTFCLNSWHEKRQNRPQFLPIILDEKKTHVCWMILNLWSTWILLKQVAKWFIHHHPLLFTHLAEKPHTNHANSKPSIHIGWKSGWTDGFLGGRWVGCCSRNLEELTLQWFHFWWGFLMCCFLHPSFVVDGVFMYHVLFLWRGGYQYSHDWGVRRLVSTKKLLIFRVYGLCYFTKGYETDLNRMLGWLPKWEGFLNGDIHVPWNDTSTLGPHWNLC